MKRNLLIILFCSLSLSQAQQYYLDVNSPVPDGNGLSWATAFRNFTVARIFIEYSPHTLPKNTEFWRQNYNTQLLCSADFLDVNSGNYGVYIEKNFARSRPLVIRAAKGKNHQPVITSVRVENTKPMNTRLWFLNLKFKGGTKFWRYLKNAFCVTFENCIVLSGNDHIDVNSGGLQTVSYYFP